MKNPKCRQTLALSDEECLHYRDEFRSARYAALADAESFSEICFALEALGLRLCGTQIDLSTYQSKISRIARKSPVFNGLAKSSTTQFKTFDALYDIVRKARNDAMHIGAYARHATEAAIELCIGLEEALMANVNRTVGNLMVKSPITVAPWQPLAHARQIMLMHSFSFLPVRVENEWWLVSELGLAKFLNVNADEKRNRLGMTIQEVLDKSRSENTTQELLVKGAKLSRKQSVEEVLKNSNVGQCQTLWLIVEDGHPDHLAGVLSPFELM